MRNNVVNDSNVVNGYILKSFLKHCKLGTMKPAPRPYHHGNLRQELLRAAETALETRGIQQLSLRELSSELGVSHASPQRHFATKQELIDALAIEGFDRLGSAMARAAEARRLDFSQRLTKAALAYVEFARKHPALLALMFEAKRQPVIPAELHAALLAAFSHIPGILKEGQETGMIVPGDPYRMALTIGAAMQGLVALSIDGKVKGVALKTLVPEIIQHLLNGLRVNEG
jgi:AcrR family transcriptional regulator